MNSTAVILAGGKSSRMGRDKALLSFGGKPLIEHGLTVVREAGAGEVLISGRAGQDLSGLGCRVLLDLRPDCGPLGGIERALQEAAHPLVLVLAVDLPHMTVECVRWVLSEAADAPAVGGAVPTADGRLEPLAAVYPRAALEIARAMLDEKCLAAREFAGRCAGRGLVRSVPVPEEHRACFTNWNTPEDLRG